MPFNPQDAIACNSQRYQRISLVARLISWTCHMSHQNEFPAETVQTDCSRARFSTWLRTGCDTTSCGTTPTWGWSPLYTVYSRIYANTEAETINNCSTTVVVVVASNRPFKATNYNHPPTDVGNTETGVCNPSPPKWWCQWEYSNTITVNSPISIYWKFYLFPLLFRYNYTHAMMSKLVELWYL